MPAAGHTGRVVREVEHKFRVSGAFALPDLTGLAGAVQDLGVVHLETTYFDTVDLRLVRERITLRRRTGGEDAGWHLKLPASETEAGVRDELQLPLMAAPDDRPPPDYSYLVQAIARHDPVAPRARLRTRRTTRILRDHAGAALAELVDDVVDVLAPDGRITARFRELELEEREAASDEFVSSVRDVLVRAGAVGGEFITKAVRALGPEAAAEPEVPALPPPPPAAPARLVVAEYLSRYIRDLRAADIDARRDVEDSVHQLRVAARRLRSGLRVFRPLLDREWADALRSELRWAASELGDYRDTEVLLSRLGAGQPEVAEPARERLRRVLTERMGTARDQVRGLLGSDRYLALHEHLVVAAAAPATTERAEHPASEVLPPLVAKAWHRFAGRVEKLLTDEAETVLGAPDDEWHATRIAAKRVRYAADAVAPVLGTEAARFAKALSRVTDVLGEHQDAAHAAAMATASATDAEPPLAFSFGVLCGAERAEVTAARVRFGRLWPKVSKERLRQWFES